MAAGYCYFLGINSNAFFLKDNKKTFILGLNVPKVTAYYRSNKLQPDENKKLGEGEFIALTVEENFVPEQQTPAGWQVERLILKSPTGDEMEIKCTNLFAVAELLRKMS